MNSPRFTSFRRAEILAVLAHRSFRYVFLAHLTSSVGNAIYSIALPLLILQEEGSALALGYTYSAAAISFIFVGPLAGVLADRLDRKSLMILSLAAQAVVLAALLAAGLMVDLHTLHFAVAAFFLSLASQLFYPARAAILPNLLPSEALVAGNAALTAGNRIIDIGGKAAAGFFVATIGGLSTFAIILAAYVLAALLIAKVTAPEQTKRRRTTGPTLNAYAKLVGMAKDALADLGSSIAFIFKHPLLRALAVAGLILNAFHLPAMLILPPLFLKETLNEGPEAYGLFGSIESAAMLIALPAVPWVARRIGDGRVSLFSLTALGILIGGFTLAGQLWQVLAIAAFTGLLTAGVMPMQSIVQAASPDHMRGRVVANLAAINLLLVVLTGPLLASLVDVIGPRPMFLAAGVAVVLSGVALMGVKEVREARIGAASREPLAYPS